MGTPTQLSDKTGRVVFEGTQDGGGGSQPVVGQPKASDDTTYFGLPPAVTGSSAWITPNTTEDGTFVWYAPLLLTAALTITDIEVLVDQVPAANPAITGVNQGTKTFTIAGDFTAEISPGSSVTVSNSANNGTYSVVSATFTTDHTDVVVVEAIPEAWDGGNMGPFTSAANIRVAITALDTDWQPTGDVLYQHEINLEAGGPAHPGQIDVSGVDLALQPGLYAFVREVDDSGCECDMRPASFPGAIHCEDVSTKVIDGFTAPHVYAPFVGTLPQWDTADVDNDSGAGIEGFILYPFVVKWTTP